MKHAKYFEELDRGMADAVDRFLDEVSEDPEASLDPRTAHLATLAALIGCQGEKAFRAELSVALDDGVSPEEAREVVCQSVAYMGIGRSAQFARAMTDVFEERGIRDLEDIVMLPDDERIVRGSGLQAEAFGLVGHLCSVFLFEVPVQHLHVEFRDAYGYLPLVFRPAHERGTRYARVF